MRNLHILYVVAIISGLLVSCTREIDESVNISIDTSQLSSGNPGSQSAVPVGFYPRLLLANLHYDGKTEVVEWQCDNSLPAASCVYPSSVNFGGKRFPNGADRTAQVLLIYENSQNQILFYYAHALNLNFGGGQVNVTINNWVNNGSSVGTGNVSGRYYDYATSSGPTGKLIGSYSPPIPPGYTAAQIPEMKLFKSYMFNGYFQVFFVRGSTKFTWSLVNDSDVVVRKLFQQKSFEDFTVGGLIAGKQVTYIRRPNFYRVHPGVPPSMHSYLSEAESTVLGFFKANGPEGEITYYSPTDAPNAGFYFRAIGGGAANSELPLADHYRFDPGTGVLVNPINMAINPTTGWVNPSNPSTSASAASWVSYMLEALIPMDNGKISVHGGRTTDASGCVSALNPVGAVVSDNCFKVMLAQDAESGVAPFRGPFALQMVNVSPNRYNFLKVAPSAQSGNSSTHKEIFWEYLSGVTGPSMINGTDVLVVPRAIIDNEDEKQGLNCESLASNYSSGIVASITDMQPVAQKVEIANASIAANHEVLLCPFSTASGTKKYYPFGIATDGISYGVSPINVTMTIPATVALGSCTQVDVSLTRPSSASINLQINSSFNALNINSGCGSGGDAQGLVTLTYNPGSMTQTFYIDAEIASNVTLSFTASGSDAFAAISNRNLTVNPPASPSLSVSGLGGTVSEHICTSFTLTRSTDAIAEDIILPADTATVKFKFFSDSSCLTPITGPIVHMPVSIPSVMLGMKAIVGANQPSLSLVFSHANYTSAGANIGINDTAAMIFVTTSAYAAGTTGVTWGDSICQSVAATAGLPATMTYIAILSDSTANAVDRVLAAASGKSIFNSKAQVVAPALTGTGGLFSLEDLAFPIYSEDGQFLAVPMGNDGFIWTGSDYQGTYGGLHCNNWTDATSGQEALNGPPSVLGTPVVNSNRFNRGGTSIPCDSQGRLYCVGN